MDTAQSGSRSVDDRDDRPRLRSACEGCRSRKVRCTGERPCCARCTRQGARCVYLSRGSGATSSRSAAAMDERQRSSSPPRRLGAFGPASTHQQPDRSSQARHPRSSSASISLSQRQALDMSFTSPAASSSTGGDHHGTVERGPSIQRDRSATPPSHVIPRFPYSSQLVHPLPAAPDLLPRPDCSTEIDKGPGSTLKLALLPELETVHNLLSHLACCSNAAFPILHMPTLKDQANEGFTGKTITVHQACILLLALAVSIQSLPKRSALFHLTAKFAGAIFGEAQPLLASVQDAAPSLEKLQVRLLLLQYTLYNPKQGNIWELSGSALRLAIDLGLHHERGPWATHSAVDPPPLEVDMRRRLFWSAFCIDRNLSIALGRPPGIPDHWINVQMISSIPDSALRLARDPSLHAASSTDSEGQPPCPTKLSAIHHIRIRRLQSEIQDRLYRLPNTGPHPDSTSQGPSPEWFSDVRHRLVAWRQTAPPPSGFCSAAWFDLNYYITLTLLHRPSPMIPKPSKDALKLARQGASGIMRTYKDMLKADRINWRWLAMYQLFIAGIAYLNSLWQAAEQGWTIVPSYVEALLDMQVCTSVMSSLSATTPGFTSLCTAFETVSERIIRELTAKASWGQASSRASSPFGHGASTANISHAALITTDPVPANRAASSDSSAWNSAGMIAVGNAESIPAGSDGPTAAGIADIEAEFDLARYSLPDPNGTTSFDAMDGNYGSSGSIVGTSGGIDDILTALGLDREPQATFDSFFLHPLPEFPSDDWTR